MELKVSVLTIAFLAIATAALAKDPMVGGAPMYNSNNIVENALRSKDHTTLVAAVKAAGLVDVLEGSGPFTVFAPTNEAFRKLPMGTVDNLLLPESKGQLEDVLKYHIVRGRFSAQDLLTKIKIGGGEAKLETIQGGYLIFKENNRGIEIIDGHGDVGRVTIPNVVQSNGVIHVINLVMRPSRVIKEISDAKNNTDPDDDDTPQQKPTDFFPWPAPAPSAHYVFTDLFTPNGRTNLSDVANGLEKALDKSGFTDHFYFGQHTGHGFVLLTRAERIDDEGRSVEEKRWNTDVKISDHFEINNYLQALAGRLHGRFRTFAFVVTRDDRPPSDTAMTMRQANEWEAKGLPSLPRYYKKILLTRDYAEYALIYEFFRPQDGDVVFVKQSAINGAGHIRGAGIQIGASK